LVLIAYALFLFHRFFSLYGLGVILATGVAFFAQLTAFKSKLLTWTLTVSVMWILNMNSFQQFMLRALSEIRSDAFTEFVCCMYFMVLRMLGFSIDRVNALAAEKSDKEPDLKERYGPVNFAFYSFYPSFVFTAMFMPFNNFRQCVSVKYEIYSIGCLIC
jgi:hypothetical protein